MTSSTQRADTQRTALGLTPRVSISTRIRTAASRESSAVTLTSNVGQMLAKASDVFRRPTARASVSQPRAVNWWNLSLIRFYDTLHLCKHDIIRSSHGSLVPHAHPVEAGRASRPGPRSPRSSGEAAHGIWRLRDP